MSTKKIIVGIVVGIAAFYVVSTIIVDRKLTKFENNLQTDIASQLETVSLTAALLGRGGANSVVEQIIPDCSSLDVARYDTLLSSLDQGLNNLELQELDSLFNRCGDIASARRSVMVLALTEQVKNLNLLVSHYQNFSKNTADTALVNDWNDLVVLEQEISQHFNLLVKAQGDIITALISNTPSSALTVENIRVEAEEIRSQLTELTGKAAPLRTRLINS